MAARTTQGENPEPVLEGHPVEESPRPRHSGGGSFQVIFRGKMRVVVEVHCAVGVAAAESQQFDGAKEGFVEPSGQPEVAVHQVMRS